MSTEKEACQAHVRGSSPLLSGISDSDADYDRRLCRGVGRYTRSAIKSFLRADMYHQYAPFFMDFLEKLKHGESLTDAWGKDRPGKQLYSFNCILSFQSFQSFCS